jgi:hypothetical protein
LVTNDSNTPRQSEQNVVKPKQDANPLMALIQAASTANGSTPETPIVQMIPQVNGLQK